MPLIQTPQWTEFLSCPVCYHEFNENIRRPISLGCGHTVCKTCLSQLQRKQCPFDQAPITQDIDDLPANYALLQLVGAEVTVEEQKIPANVVSRYMKHYAEAKACIEELALYLKPLGVNGTGSTNCVLSRPMQRKLVTLVNCQLVEEEGRSRAMRAARSLGERTVTELMLQHQNTQQLSANLWAAVRARGCQFLGPAMQEETLKLVLLALEDGNALSRKVLVMFVVQKLEEQFPQASKTSVGHVVQLLYRASCFKVTKREEESSLMQLKEEFRNYEALRREHDAQIVTIAIEGGLRISPEQWSSLLYGDLNHKSHMQSIIDKQLQTPASFTSSIQELTIALQRSGDPANLSKLRDHLKLLADISPNSESEPPAWEDVEYAMISTKIVVHGLVEFISHHSHSKKILEQQQTQNIKFKTSMCRDITQKGGCPRGNNCTFAHSEDELDRYRAKSRRMLSTINRQNSNQSVRMGPSQASMIGDRMLPRGMTSPPMSAASVIDPEADDGLNERNFNRESVLGLSPRHGVHSPEPLQYKSDERPIRYPPYSLEDMQIPYKPPGHYNQYVRDYRGHPPPTSTPPPRPPSSTTQYGRMLHGHPKDQYTTKPPIYRHQDSGDDYMHPAHGMEKESHPLHYDGVRKEPDPTGPYPSPYQRYKSPMHSDHDADYYPKDDRQFASPASGPIGSFRHLLSDNSSEEFGQDMRDFRKHEGWSSGDQLDYLPPEMVEKQERERNEKEAEKSKVDTYLRNIETPPNIPTNLIELQQRHSEIVAKLNQVKTPWEHSALTTVVSSNQGRPKSSVVIDSGRERYPQASPVYETGSGYKYFDPWTSTAQLFPFFKPGKEHGTKYTMTVSKSQIKHVSAKETEQMALEKPHQGKEHPEFSQMNLNELRSTMEKVKLQDSRTGCTHFERSQELNQELIKREQSSPEINYVDPPHVAPSFYQDNDYIPSIWGPPVSRASRTSFNITPPVKVNAGPTGPGGGPRCTPVSMNLNNQMVPIAGQSPVVDKNTHHRELMHQDGGNPSDKSGESEDVSKSQQYKQELEHELAQVKSQIAKQRTAKTANDAFLIQREAKALRDTRLPIPPQEVARLQLQKDVEMAKRLQNQEFQELQGVRSSSPYSPTTFTMDQDFPPLSRDVLDLQAQDKRMAENVQRYEEAKALRSYNQRYHYDAEIRDQLRQRQQQQRQQQQHQQQEQRLRQEKEDQEMARQVARAEARAIGVRLPPENKGYQGGASSYPRQ